MRTIVLTLREELVMSTITVGTENSSNIEL
ncbi:hypothetical protein IWX88_002432 [Frigoribacterium sp. CG_9.8]|nr:hypothetical protein [Frigoribacterium sp. CG_9.8]